MPGCQFKYIFICLIVAGISLASSSPWGFYAHKKINSLAVYTLPQELFGFYKKHQDFLFEHAVDPDKRRYSVKGEAQRHYIDIDHYCKHFDGCDPFTEVPRRWNDAVEKFSEDTLQAYGIVPWHINLMVYQLTEAFKELDEKRILRLSAEMGHYVGDAHVPLHTTENYNGQLTNQIGIHGFWESRIPELFDADYDFFVDQAIYIEEPLDMIWDIIAESHHGLDSVLLFEKQLSSRWPEDKKYVYEERGRVVIKNYSEEYARAYQISLNGQPERRMRQAIRSIGSLWFTAWVNAGQPNLDFGVDPLDTSTIEDEIARELNMPQLEELKTRTHE